MSKKAVASGYFQASKYFIIQPKGDFQDIKVEK
jgi:hypothetical protein